MNIWEKIGVAIAGIAIVAGIAYHAVGTIPGSSAFTLLELSLKNPLKSSIAIVIDSSSTYAALKSKISRFRFDIIRDTGARVKIILPPSSQGWSNVAAVKSALAREYNSSNLVGAILVGDIPAPYFEYQHSGSTPSDWYYQDMSDKFIDEDGDWRFEREHYMTETDITRREIWTGRLKPPVGGAEGIEMLSKYLDRNHAYRTGQLAYDKQMLFFNSILINHKDDDIPDVTDDQYVDLVRQIGSYTGLYEPGQDKDVDYVYSDVLEEQKDQYLKKLSDVSYDFVFVNVHGSWGSQWLGENVYVSRQEIRDVKSKTFFVELASCSNGDFTAEDYFAGNLLFSGNTLVVAANSTVAMLMNSHRVGFLKGFQPLRLGVSFGQMSLNDNSFLVRHLFGDPTLQLRKKPSGPLPAVQVDGGIINFGPVKKGGKISLPVIFGNTGQSQLVVENLLLYESIDTEPLPENGPVGFVTYQAEGDSRWLQPIRVPPKTSTKVLFTISISKNLDLDLDPHISGGQYSATGAFFTNDPNQPYLELKFKAQIVN